jgi:ABC-type glycerol-3-phosphate transport system permease component
MEIRSTLRKIRKIGNGIIVYGIPVMVALITVAPLVYVVIISFQHVIYLAGDPRLWFSQPLSLTTYEFVIKKTGMLRWMLNSLVVASGVTAIGLVLYSAAGYAFFRNRHHKLVSSLFGLVLVGIMIPKAVTMVPTFIMARELHLNNTYAGLIIPPLAIPVGVFLIRQAMFAFPLELVDAARIDGCSEFSAFWRIVLPILAPNLVVVSVYTFMDQWREFIWPLIITSTKNMSTIPVGLSTLTTEFRTDYGNFMAGVMIAMLPGIVMFLLFQRQFLKGVTAGALKE